MDNPTVNFDDVMQYLREHDLSRNEHAQLVDLINARMNAKKRAAVFNFNVGDKVTFVGKYGITHAGTVVKSLRTRLHVQVPMSGGQTWTVPATICKKVG